MIVLMNVALFYNLYSLDPESASTTNSKIATFDTTPYAPFNTAFFHQLAHTDSTTTTATLEDKSLWKFAPKDNVIINTWYGADPLLIVYDMSSNDIKVFLYNTITKEKIQVQYLNRTNDNYVNPNQSEKRFIKVGSIPFIPRIYSIEGDKVILNMFIPDGQIGVAFSNAIPNTWKVGDRVVLGTTDDPEYPVVLDVHPTDGTITAPMKGKVYNAEMLYQHM